MAWPPARAAGWKASPKGRRRNEKGCFSGHEPAARGKHAGGHSAAGPAATGRDAAVGGLAPPSI
eukprot:4698021-Prymnesium_polylepis.1